MRLVSLLRSKAVGWTLYSMLIAILVVIFVDIIGFKEVTVHYFNRDGKAPVDVDINSLDYLGRTLDCEINIPRHAGLKLRMVHVHSWEWSDFFKEKGLGPDFEAYFIHPTEEDIYGLRAEDIDHLKRKFQFKVSGSPGLYPFDAYKAEFGMIVLNVIGEGKKAGPLAVTTRVQENLPGFYITDAKEKLTFQGVAEKAQKFGVQPQNTFSFRLVRGKFLRLFTVYIYSLAFIFMIYIGFRRSTKEVLGQGLGYFAALWGIRNIISGKVEIFPTMIDYFTLVLFTMLVLIIVGRLLHNYYEQEHG
jgi:hypothetical protein